MFNRLKVRLYCAFIAFGISAQILVTRRRMSHDNGAMASGTVEIVEHPEFPAIDIFEPGKVYGCRIRHGMASTDDDAKLLVRGCSVKFGDVRRGSPFALLMNTGQRPLFSNIRNFLEFAKIFNAKAGPRGTDCQEFRGVRWIPYMQKYDALVNWREAMRRNPESYARLYYYSKMPQHYRANDGVVRYCKFRITPGDKGEESGVLKPGTKDWTTPWYYNRLPGELRSRNYLRHEYEERVQRGPVEYWLQMQLHEWKDGDSDEVFDSFKPWDEATHPWLDVAKISVDKLAGYEEERLTVFAIKDRPKSLDIIAPKSIDDPNSMNYLRVWAIWPRRARLLGQKLFGYASRPTDYFHGWPGQEGPDAAGR